MVKRLDPSEVSFEVLEEILALRERGVPHSRIREEYACSESFLTAVIRFERKTRLHETVSPAEIRNYPRVYDWAAQRLGRKEFGGTAVIVWFNVAWGGPKLHEERDELDGVPYLISDPVLAVTGTGEMMVVKFERDPETGFDGWITPRSSWVIENVTHWAPLPKKPEGMR